MTTLESNRCYACRKLFCCAECCTEHIKKKHPGRESKCPLCRSERLRIKDFENAEFLTHVVFNHLPLHCHSCGKYFNTCDDLRNIGACIPRRPLIQVNSAINQVESPLSSPDVNSPFNKTPCDLSAAERLKFTIRSDFNGNFGNFTSPPELIRNTSTPMQVSLAVNGKFQIPQSPSSALKTPKATNIPIKNTRLNDRSTVKENNIENESCSKNSPISDTVYYSISTPAESTINDHRTPLRSILSNQSTNIGNSTKQDTKISGQKLDTMQDANKEMSIEISNSNMDFTGVMANFISEDCTNDFSYVNSSQQPVHERRGFAKKVRFSNQFESKSDTGITSISQFNISTENEEFFEAQQNIPGTYDVDNISISEVKFDTVKDIRENMNIEDSESVDMEITNVVENIIAVTSSQQNLPAEEEPKFIDQFEIKSEAGVPAISGYKDSTDSEEFVDARQNISEMSLVVVDKLSNSATLIDRENAKNFKTEISKRVSLTKSPQITDSNQPSTSQSSSSGASRVVMMVVVEQNGNFNSVDLGPLISSSLKKLENITAASGSNRENPSSQTQRVNEHGNLPTTVVSVDSYVSVSTVERFANANSRINSSQSPQNSIASSNSGNGGIFSALAQAMRTAFKNFSGSNSTKHVPSDPVSQQRIDPPVISSHSDSGAASSNVLTSLTSALVARPAKRSRDELYPVQSSEAVDPLNDVRSPVPKRPRGWCKIRAREPIARMRSDSLTSPRGASSATQRFQQGLLSIGDTILPLPSRAHQSTQTD